MIEFHKVWVAQCEAAREIRARRGTPKALGYLIGEKLVEFLRMAERAPEWREQLPLFVAEIKQLFSPEEIRGYLDGVRRVGPLGHVLSDDEFEEFRAAGAVEDDPVGGAEDVLRVDAREGSCWPNEDVGQSPHRSHARTAHRNGDRR